MSATVTALPAFRSSLLMLAQDRVMQRSQQQLRIIHAMARRMHATELLAARLQGDRHQAVAMAEEDNYGIPFPLVVITGDADVVSRWMNSYGVPFDALDRSIALGVRTYVANVNGQSVSVVIKQETGHGS